MTIYIAVCDDNIADRKQTERLLEREKDKRLRENYDVLYIDSFGSDEALLHATVKYDLFLIDLTNSDINGMDLAIKLRRKGIIAPLVLCSSSIDYSSYIYSPEDIIYINKPINKGQIEQLVDVALDYSSKKTPLLKVNTSEETFYIKHTDLIKATAKAKFITQLALSDGRYVEIGESFESFVRICQPYGCFILCGKWLINLDYVKAPYKNGFYLYNGDYIKYSVFNQKKIIATYSSYHNKPSDT